MAQVTVPAWDIQGILPPVDLSDPTSLQRSPYCTNLEEIVRRFCLTRDRCRILKGLLDFRSDIYASGLYEGFQWLDGSFFENIESTGRRSPKDIDIVTFYKLPSGQTHQDILNRNSRAFDYFYQKQPNFVDNQFVDLGGNPEFLVERAAYWYSVWSHRRDFLWKGYVQVALDSQYEKEAREYIISYMKMEANNE